MESSAGDVGIVRFHVESLKFYRPQHRRFLLDESRVPGEELDKSKGMVVQLLRLERAQEPEQVRQIVSDSLP